MKAEKLWMRIIAMCDREIVECSHAILCSNHICHRSPWQSAVENLAFRDILIVGVSPVRRSKLYRLDCLRHTDPSTLS